MNHFNATKVYELPDEIAKRSDWLLKAHVDALLSVGKRTLGTSVSAKLEPSFDYKRKKFLTTDKLYQAVADAINRELKYLRINNEKITITKTDVEECIFAFYRDLVEGGKLLQIGIRRH